MNIEIGTERIINTADTITVFAVQIGVTRICAGGRCQPRTRRGAMATVANLVAQIGELPEVIELVVLPRVAAAVAPLARAVVAMAAWVIVQPVVVLVADAIRSLLRTTFQTLRSLLSLKTAGNFYLAAGFVGFCMVHPVTARAIHQIGHSLLALSK